MCFSNQVWRGRAAMEQLVLAVGMVMAGLREESYLVLLDQSSMRLA